MAASLSAYWVKFFQGAGFPLDVATRHAVVFSNNRIKPDMLPDLDKASLKDMGITLIGDMIAILRYAKKVVEAVTCENFLVDTEDDKPRKKVKPSVPSRDIVKTTAVVKAPSKVAATNKQKIVQESVSKAPTKSATPSGVTRSALIKKKVAAVPRIITQVTKEPAKPTIVKRKLVREVSESESDEVPEIDLEREERHTKSSAVKRTKLTAEEEKVGYTVIMPKGRTIRSQQILMKISDQKRTVFDRLGDSSVTSTTNLAETTAATATTPTFNITGLGNDALKRNLSVFTRLGDKDAIEKVRRIPGSGAPKDTSDVSRPGILKATRPSAIGSTTVTIKPEASIVANKSIGTMHADYEKSQKTTSNGVRQLVRTAKKIRLSDHPKSVKLSNKVVAKVNTTSKLASERVGIVPAKARLGLGGSSATKQVTFDRFAKVSSFEKPGVFSRLGF